MAPCRRGHQGCGGGLRVAGGRPGARALAGRAADAGRAGTAKRPPDGHPGPRDRFGAALCQTSDNNVVYVWGGHDEPNTERWNDLWMYGSRSSFIQEGWETWKSDQTFAAASLAAAMSTICFFIIFCYLIMSLVTCIRRRRGSTGFEYRHEEFG